MSRHSDLSGLAEALRALAAAKRKPTVRDAPAFTAFPMTVAAREALRLDHEKSKPRQTHRR